MKSVGQNLSKALKIFIIMTIICGVIYTALITGIAQTFAGEKANGSIIEANGKKYGSELIAQKFTDDSHMWGRVMNIDTKTFKDKDGKILMYASPSNLSPASEEYEKLIKERVEKIKKRNPDMAGEKIPVDLVTSSGSGLDPHISRSAAEYQVKRIARVRGVSEDYVRDIVERATNKKLLGFLGEETVNVLKVNLMLDGIIK
jgi:K+-transporting ATPase ATPase C chain